MDNKIYMSRQKARDDAVAAVCDATMEVYDAKTVRCQNVPNARGIVDMTMCERYRRLHICILVILLVDVHVRTGRCQTCQPVNDKPTCLSVNATHDGLVTCNLVGKMKEFSTHDDSIYMT